MYILPRRRRALDLRRILLCLAALVLIRAAAGAQQLQWIQFGDSWRYLKGQSDPPAGWSSLEFDDTSWSEGRTGIGYGGGDDVTILSDMRGKYWSFYARRSLNVDDTAGPRKLFLRISYASGFVAYLNGTEVVRKGLGAPGSEVHYNTPASSHEAGVMEAFDLTPSLPLLVPGRNVLAVEVHNNTLSSSDVSFSPVLTAFGPGAALRRGPCLQLVTGSSVLIVWETDPATVGAVEHGPTGGLGSVLAEGQAAEWHEIRLTDLQPGSEHSYRILAGGVPISPVFVFRTAPTASLSRFRMGAFGDTEKLNAGFLGAPPILEGLRPDFAILAGDVIREADVDTYVYDNLRRVFPTCPIYPAPGNHDLDDDDGKAYFGVFYLPTESSGTERYYSFNYGNAHVVSLDTVGSFAAGSTQYEWLRQDLSSNDRLWTMVFFHHSPYSTGTTHGSDLTIRRELCPVFDEFKVDLVFTGHNHNYERTYPVRAGKVTDTSRGPTYVNPQGTIYVVTGGAGGTLYAQSSSADKTFSAIFKLANHVCQIDVDGGQLTLKAIDIAGSVLETIEIRKSPPVPPVISNCQVHEVRGTSASVSWATDEPADSVAEYGLAEAFDLRVSDETPVVEHSLTLTDLEASTPYGVRVRSTGADGGEAVSEPLAFLTMDLFARGDTNQDGNIDLSDAVKVLLFLFADVPPPPCLDALDADDNGDLNVTDAVFLLSFLFRGGPSIPPPGLPGGDDPTGDSLDCRRPG